jgi:hypothetical protein
VDAWLLELFADDLVFQVIQAHSLTCEGDAAFEEIRGARILCFQALRHVTLNPAYHGGKNHENPTFFAASLLTVSNAAQAITAWIPAGGAGSIDTSFTASTFDTFLVGENNFDSPLGGSVDQYSIRIGVTYGLMDWL